MTGPRQVDPFFTQIETHRARWMFRAMRLLPHGPRCAICNAPYGPSRKNPRLCDVCFEKAPMGGSEMLSRRAHDRAGAAATGAAPRELTLKGKEAPERAMVLA